ncbi:DUF2304 family protein [Candidatus Gottesmanbacteria bacterium]|nr:DUF2304 family protein [Candidatus Gottesmanbacteria bacterium]
MPITLTQIFLFSFLLFALTRVILRLKSGELSLFGFIFWSGIFGLAMVVVLFPGITSNVAKILGIGRGADVIVYISVSLLFYLVFRLYIFIEDIRHDITELIQKLALRDINENKKSKSKQK